MIQKILWVYDFKNRIKSISEIGRSSKVVVEYLFDYHTLCDENGADLCYMQD